MGSVDNHVIETPHVIGTLHVIKRPYVIGTLYVIGIPYLPYRSQAIRQVGSLRTKSGPSFDNFSDLAS